MGRLRLQQRVLSLAFLLCMLNSMDRDLLYFWFHDYMYSKVEMWYSKKIGSLPERVSAPDRSVFFLFSTTMRSPFKIRKPFRRHFMGAPDRQLRMQIRYFTRRQPREPMVQKFIGDRVVFEKNVRLCILKIRTCSRCEKTSRFSMWQYCDVIWSNNSN